MHPALVTLREATRGAEYENNLWLVGGAVRDVLLGLEEAGDFDIVSERDTQALVRDLHRRGIVPPPTEYPRFGTAMVVLKGATLEFVTARRESYNPESRKPDIQPATLLEDALRRDFTCNTLLRNLHSNELRDLLGNGLQDLKAKILRTPQDPRATFEDDPLRMLRAVRFKHRLGFKEADGLQEAILEKAPRLAIVSPERMRDEIQKMLLGPKPQEAMRDLMDLGVLDAIVPEFSAMRGVEQGKYHHLDVWDHTLLVLQNLPKPTTESLALAALLHDVGKPATRFVDAEGATRFYDHENVGADLARTVLNRFRHSNNQIDQIVKLVANHMRLGSFQSLSTPAARRLVRDMGDLLEPLLDLVEADAAALKPGVRVMDLDPIRLKLEEVSHQTPAASLKSPLDGNRIMELTGAEGAEIGRWKALLLEEVLEGRLAYDDAAAAETWVQEMLLHRRS